MNHDETVTVRPLTLAWVGRHLEAGERIVKAEALHGGITAEMRRLIIGVPSQMIWSAGGAVTCGDQIN